MPFEKTNDKMVAEKAFSQPSRGRDEEIAPIEGQVEELRKDFSVWSLGSLCLCLMATWEAVTSVVAQALTNGGAPCLFYNYIISFLGTIAVASSLAEIASIYPTAGGQYHWVAVMAPKKQRIIASWFTGWISVGGQIVLTASAAFAAGLQLQGLITLNHPDTYVPQRWQGTMFYWLILLYAAIVNIWGSKILPHTNIASGILHVGCFVIFLIILGVLAPKHDTHYVFVEVSNTSGWSNDGVSWMVGILSTVYPFLGYDAATHLAEEMPNPSRNVPIAMVGSCIVNGIIGFGWVFMLLFSLGDLNDLLASATGFPFMQLFLNVTKSQAGATVMIFLLSCTAIVANTAGLTSTSRTYWAFARDSGTPFSKYFSHVHAKKQVPVRAILAVTVLEMLLGLIYIGNSTAFNAILSMSVLGMYASYLIPILYMLLNGRKNLTQAEYGPFKLGRPGPLINAIAICWLVLAGVFSTFPTVKPVTQQNMNYSSVVLVGWIAFGAVFFFWFGEKIYSGPEIRLEK